MPVCRLINYYPLGTVDDLLNYCTRPSTSCNSVSDRPRHPRDNSFEYTTNMNEITVYYITNIKALGLVLSGKKIFLKFSS